MPSSSFINLRSTSGVVYLDNEKTPILFDVFTLFIPQDRTSTSRRPIFVYTKDIFSRFVRLSDHLLFKGVLSAGISSALKCFNLKNKYNAFAAAGPSLRRPGKQHFATSSLVIVPF